MTSTIGRTVELARAGEALATQPAAGVLFVGAAGIGKSTVLAAAADLAASLGFQVRRSRAAASERDLPYVGLHDLIGDAVAEASVSLSAPLRRALEVVLLRADPPEGGLDVLAVDLAVLEVLEHLATVCRLALVLDDVQWLDQPTRQVLDFVLRRLPAGRVVVLAAAREVTRGVETLMLEPYVLVEIGPLTPAEIADLVEVRTGVGLSPQRVVALHRLSGGNAFLALELVRSGSAGHRGLGEFSVPERHLRVLETRISSLPAPARRALLAAALSSRPTPELLAGVAGVEGLTGAEAAGVLHVSATAVEVDHPLLAGAARRGAGGAAEREMHLTLASAADDPIERARHRALGTLGEDARLAEELEAAARLAADRAAIGVAAELSRYALERTPAGAVSDRVRRAVAAARWFHQCGEGEEARAVVAPVLQSLPAGSRRAQCLIALAEAAGQDIAGALALLSEALEQPDLDPNVVLEARMQRAGALMIAGELEQARDEAARAYTGALRAGAADQAAACSMFEALADYYLGVPPERSQAWARTRPWRAGLTSYWHPDLLLAYAARGRDDPRRATALLERLVRQAQEKGDLESEAGLAMHLAEVAVRDGRLADAAVWAERSWRDARVHCGLYVRGLGAAWSGDLDGARRLAGSSLRMAQQVADACFEVLSLAVLGFVEVSAQRLEDAAEYEMRLVERVARMKLRGPGVLPPWQGDAVEAFLGTGRAQEAAAVTADLWAQADHWDLRGLRGLAAHCDGLVQAYAGDLKLAEDHLARAVSLMAGLDMPLERARTLLALGTVLRRRRQRATARDALSEAHTIFVGAGAAVWAERAAQELRRTSAGRAGDELSQGEQRVAELAAVGRTNREIAAQLYLSPKTVETILTHVYRKLGVRSRTELSRLLGPSASPQGVRRG